MTIDNSINRSLIDMNIIVLDKKNTMVNKKNNMSKTVTTDKILYILLEVALLIFKL